MLLIVLSLPSTSIEQIAEEHADAAAELAVGKIQNHERQRENPEKSDSESQEEIDEPQGQQTGDEGHNWIFNQVVHNAKDSKRVRGDGGFYLRYCCIFPMSS